MKVKENKNRVEESWTPGHCECWTTGKAEEEETENAMMDYGSEPKEKTSDEARRMKKSEDCSVRISVNTLHQLNPTRFSVILSYLKFFNCSMNVFLR